jgi:lipopolysaccharide biosynthesis glycosyltransferase
LGTNRTSEVINIVTSSNEKYLPFIATLAKSIDLVHRSDRVHLTVLHDGIRKGPRRLLEAPLDALPVRWIEVSPEDFKAVGIDNPQPLMRPHYFRCLVGSLLRSDQTRCLYLDGDTIVRQDLEPLWVTDLAGNAAGAALDYFLARVGDAIAPWRELELDPDRLHFNSGVMLIDIDVWREKGIGYEALQMCLDNPDHLLAQGKWPQYDQFGLNVVLHRDWLRLDQTWNYLSEMDDDASPAVVHFCGGGKPGSPGCQPRFATWFNEIVDQTSWSEWRAQP